VAEVEGAARRMSAHSATRPRCRSPRPTATPLLTSQALQQPTQGWAGTYAWVGVGGTLKLVTIGVATAQDIYTAPGGIITGLAFDRNHLLFVSSTTSVAGNPSGTRVSAIFVGTDGVPVVGPSPDVIAGTGASGNGPLDYAIAPTANDARAQLLATPGDCSLYIDLFGASDPAQVSGLLYLGLGVAVGTSPGWSQLAKLVPS
jgi:hypothetical protein